MQVECLREQSDYFTLNLFSVLMFNSILTRLLLVKDDQDQDHCRVNVVNISSLLGVQPLATMGFYCSGKAARDMAFKVKKTPDILQGKKGEKVTWFLFFSR